MGIAIYNTGLWLHGTDILSVVASLIVVFRGSKQDPALEGVESSICVNIPQWVNLMLP